MKSIKNILMACTAILLLFSMCKKNTTANNATTNNNTNSTSGYYSILNIYGSQYVNGNALTTLGVNSGPVFFSSVPVTTNTITSYVKVTSLSLNGICFKYYSPGYQDSIFSATTIPSTWAVVGLGVIPSFTYINNNPMPTYTGYTSLPDTIYKSQQNTIQITGITGSDETSVSVLDGGNGKVTQTLALGATSISFSASSLASLMIGNNAGISIICVKNNVQTFSGKQFNFPFTYLVNKTIYIK